MNFRLNFTEGIQTLAALIRSVLPLSVLFLTACLSGCGGGGANSGSVSVSATATTTAQSLTVGTAMTSFSPIKPTSGTAPYTYSITSGTLPAGLNLDVNTGAVTGTPTAVYATASIQFQVQDASHTVAATTSTVNFTVGQASNHISATATANDHRHHIPHVRASNYIRAKATATAQFLPVGAAMDSFSPLTPSGGVAPYAYIVKSGKLPAGLVLDSVTGAVTGTPAAIQTAANVTFAVVDANLAEAGTTSTVSFTVIRGLNDTGITASQCYQAGSAVLVACNSAGAIALNDAQDGKAGRDVTVANSADGKRGFSFSTVTSGTDVCVQDNVTGLMWEIKTTDGGMRDWTKTYTNYDSTASAQKLNVTTYVNPAQADIDAATNTVGFISAVNTSKLCGFNDWRLPTADELQSIVDYGVPTPGPTIDATWFPNTPGGLFWSSSPAAGYSVKAWGVHFLNGAVDYYYVRSGSNYVRLVRAGQ